MDEERIPPGPGGWATELRAIGPGLVIAATGVLHHPKYPEIEGVDSFEGQVFHSARWDHDVETAGKRVGVVGTGDPVGRWVPGWPVGTGNGGARRPQRNENH